MKKVLYGIGLLGTLLFAEPSMEFSLSYVGMNMDYKEYDRNGVLLDSEESGYSDIVGYEMAYGYYLDKESMVNLEFMSLSGDTKYVGSYLSSNAGYGSVVSRTYNEIKDIYLGYSRTQLSSYGVEFYGGLGIGYRYWLRELSAAQIEEYEWYSIRASAGVVYEHRDFSISLIGEYQYGIDPTMTATGISDKFKLNSADIMELSIPLRYHINKSFDLACSYTFTRQKIEESNLVFDSAARGYVEPDSTAYNQYLKVGVVFKY
jgi:hypothetical protein